MSRTAQEFQAFAALAPSLRFWHQKNIGDDAHRSKDKPCKTKIRGPIKIQWLKIKAPFGSLVSFLLVCWGFPAATPSPIFFSQLYSGLRRVGEAWIAWWASEIEEEFFLLPSPLPVASPDNKGLEIALVDRSPFRTDQRLHIVLSCLQSPKVVTVT